ncbi:MAG: gamma-glutamylcyclotransferase [Tissierellales bacterium]|nr:gamma-glutamylcyclotransferase [Tissierellales bacterium]MBN2826575.1 gamma-glutamylcyclotransferase [Tissierellales bacterium]
MTQYLFVYGTLMKNCRNHKAYLEGRYKSSYQAYAKGKIFHLQNKMYPALLGGKGRVQGELYEVIDPEDTFSMMDQLENYYHDNAYASEYLRVPITVEKENGETVQAYVYFYHITDIDEFNQNAVYIENGNWKEFIYCRR